MILLRGWKNDHALIRRARREIERERLAQRLARARACARIVNRASYQVEGKEP